MGFFKVDFSVRDKSANVTRELSRLANIANKRIKRLQLAHYEDSPAYLAWSQAGGVYFGVKGKSPAQVEREYRRVKKFLADRTSTVRGSNKLLREIAESTSVKHRTLRQLRTKLKTFFTLAQKISEYNKAAGDAAKALDYQKIWEEINQLEAEDKIRLEINANAKDWPDQIEKAMEEYIKSVEDAFR